MKKVIVEILRGIGIFIGIFVIYSAISYIGVLVYHIGEDCSNVVSSGDIILVSHYKLNILFGLIGVIMFLGSNFIVYFMFNKWIFNRYGYFIVRLIFLVFFCIGLVCFNFMFLFGYSLSTCGNSIGDSSYFGLSILDSIINFVYIIILYLPILYGIGVFIKSIMMRKRLK